MDRPEKYWHDRRTRIRLADRVSRCRALEEVGPTLSSGPRSSPVPIDRYRQLPLWPFQRSCRHDRLIRMHAEREVLRNRVRHVAATRSVASQRARYQDAQCASASSPIYPLTERPPLPSTLYHPYDDLRITRNLPGNSLHLTRNACVSYRTCIVIHARYSL